MTPTAAETCLSLHFLIKQIFKVQEVEDITYSTASSAGGLFLSKAKQVPYLSCRVFFDLQTNTFINFFFTNQEKNTLLRIDQ